MVFDEKNNLKHKKFMKRTFKKIIFIVLAITLFTLIAGVLKYSLTYIENNPEKYLPTQKWEKIKYKFTSKNLKTVLKMFYLDKLESWKSKILQFLIRILFI